MRINLPDHYSGIPSNGKPIFPGEYEDSDPRLFGLASYLVTTGHATAIEEPALTDEQVETKPGIEDLSIAELRLLAHESGLSFVSRTTKAELIALIEGAAEELGNDDLSV